MSEIPTVSGRNGFEMPILGFGTWQALDAEIEEAVEHALEAGYRHFDTAFVYQNEKCLGNVLNKWINEGKVTREELFITTKLPPIGSRPEHVTKFMDLSLEALQLTYVDLYLIHVPFGLNFHGYDQFFPQNSDGSCDLDMTTDHVAIWKKMEELVDAGKTRYIGVSNFNKNQVARLLATCRIPPVNNQIQLHVYLQTPDLVKYLQENGIVVTSYSTLGTPTANKFFGVEGDMLSVLSNDVVKSIAAEVDRSAAQVVLRHMIQKQIVVIPKSINAERIKQNTQIFDFKLNEDQMNRLDELDQNLYLIDFRAVFKGAENHSEYPFTH